MPNKTIYVSENDVSLFEEAKNIAGEALSSVISRALREYVSKNQKKSQGMEEIAVLVGTPKAEREKRFVGALVNEWKGFSDDKEWWMSASIYQTQKGNWAVYLSTLYKATLFTDTKAWKESGDYLTNPNNSGLLVGSNPKDFTNKLPNELYNTLINLMDKDEKPIEYLDI